MRVWGVLRATVLVQLPATFQRIPRRYLQVNLAAADGQAHALGDLMLGHNLLLSGAGIALEAISTLSL